MSLIHLLIALLLSSVTKAEQFPEESLSLYDTSTVCPAGWITGEASCYKIIRRLHQSWNQAFIMCRKLGGQLAEPTNRGVSNLLFNLALASFHTSGKRFSKYYIGLVDTDHSGVWQHPGTNLIPAETFWGHPPAQHRGEDCAAMILENRRFYWTPIGCGDPLPYAALCERKRAPEAESLSRYQEKTESTLKTKETGVTKSQLNRIQRLVREKLNRVTLPAIVRLAFHDCVGGCDGCINLKEEDNNGLADIMGLLEFIYRQNNLTYVMTRADFWAFSAITALRRSVELTNENCRGDPFCTVPDLDLKFQFGRRDCPTSPLSFRSVLLPGANMDIKDMLEFFYREFKLTTVETVALMGAHRLGGGKLKNSGFSGVWVPDSPDEFGNEFYRLITKPNTTWRQVNIQEHKQDVEPRYQWMAAGSFMLNSDMALYKDLHLDHRGQSSCDFQSCPPAATAKMTEFFSSDEKAWLQAFAAVFLKVQAKGNVLYDIIND